MDSLEQFISGARAARSAGDLFGARNQIERAKTLNPTGQDLVQVLITSGIVLREIGDTSQAIADLQGCLQELDNHPDLAAVMAGAAWYNLGLALREARRLPDAIDAYGQAIAQFRMGAMAQHLCMALHNRAWAYCVAGDRTSALADLAEAEPLCTTAELRHHQMIGEAFAAHLGDAESQRDAVHLCDRLVAESTGAPAAVVSHAYWLAGRAALAAGSPDAAQVMANNAVEWATRARGENRCLNDASDLLRAIKTHREGMTA